MSSDQSWRTRPEAPGDAPAVRRITLAAFRGPQEADLVDALRADPAAWVDGLSVLALDAVERPVGHALLTRCHVGDAPALALAPCAVVPEHQKTGAGSAAIRAALAAARDLGETTVVVLGHAEYYPRFGFTPASRAGINAPFAVPDDSFLALALGGTALPSGTVRYARAFGVET